MNDKMNEFPTLLEIDVAKRLVKAIEAGEYDVDEATSDVENIYNKVVKPVLIVGTVILVFAAVTLGYLIRTTMF